MKFIVTILSIVLIFGCNNSQKQDNEVKYKIAYSQNDKKLKSVTSIAYRTEIFSPDSLVFDEKIIKNFDTLGNMVEMRRYILDSTILYQHYYQRYKGDTLIKIEESIGNVYNPKLETDTLKFLDDLLIEKKAISSYRYISNGNGADIEIPLPVKLTYKYDQKKRLKSTSQLYDGIIYYCTYSYDKHGLLAQKNCVNRDSSDNLYTEKFYYNERGLKTKQTEISYLKDSVTAEYSRFYKYDKRDSLIYQSWYRNGKNFLIYTYMFNENGHKIADYIFNDSSGDSTLLAQQYYFYYDENKNLKMRSIVGSNGDPVRNTLYTYDEMHNKIEERQFAHTIDLDKRAVLTRIITKYQYEYY